MTINELEHELAALKEKQDKLTAELEWLKSEQAEVKAWRADKGSKYHIVDVDGKPFEAVDDYVDMDNNSYIFGNYYRTHELAEQDAKELALRGRIRQIRDALCEGYQFVKGGRNYYIYLDGGYYLFSLCTEWQLIGEVYFDTEEHAQQACDILNAEVSGIPRKVDKDNALQFLEECTEPREKLIANGHTWKNRTSVIYAAYCEWCTRNGLYVQSVQNFRKAICRRYGADDIKKIERKCKGTRYYFFDLNETAQSELLNNYSDGMTVCTRRT